MKHEETKYQRYDKVTPDVEKLLLLSLKNFEGHTLRDVNCPRCHICLDRVSVGTTGFLRTKCPKCKHEDILDLRYFRTAKAKCGGPKVKPLPQFMPGWINLLRQNLF